MTQVGYRDNLPLLDILLSVSDFIFSEMHGIIVTVNVIYVLFISF